MDCTKYKKTHLKDLSKLNRNLKDVILLDDTAQCMKLQPENGLVIKSFFSDLKDKELIRLIPVLTFLADVQDVRTVRDWHTKFKEKEEFPYLKLNGEQSILHRNAFLKSVVNKLHKDHLVMVFQGEKGSIRVVETPTKLCSPKKLLCESMEDLETSDVEHEELHK